jgi:uncharacterized protein (TIGR02246 family)
MNYERYTQRKLNYGLKLFVLGSTAAIIASCSGGHQGPAPGQQLMQTSRDWSRATATGNVDAIVDYWADDATVMIPGLPTFHGKAAIRRYVERSLKTPGFHISWEPVEAHVSKAGDEGYLLERSSVTMPGAKGKLETNRFRTVTIWRKGADGRWRNVVDSSIPD